MFYFVRRTGNRALISLCNFDPFIVIFWFGIFDLRFTDFEYFIINTKKWRLCLPCSMLPSIQFQVKLFNNAIISRLRRMRFLWADNGVLSNLLDEQHLYGEGKKQKFTIRTFKLQTDNTRIVSSCGSWSVCVFIMK